MTELQNVIVALTSLEAALAKEPALARETATIRSAFEGRLHALTEMAKQHCLQRGVKLPVWYETPITRKQLDHLDLLCRFHLAESQNDCAKEETRRLQHCLKYWPKSRQLNVPDQPPRTRDVKQPES